MGPRLAPRQYRRLGRLDGHDPYGRFQFLEPGADAADRASRTDAGHEQVDPSVRVAPDFLGRRPSVHGRIGRIGELLENDRARRTVAQSLRLGDSPFHAFGSGRQHDAGSEGREQVAPLDAHRIGHRQRHAVSFGRSDKRQPDARVAARGFDDLGPGLQNAPSLGVFDHRQRDAVLDASSRVEIFQLGDQRRLQAVLTAVVRQFQQRRAADQIRQMLGYFAHIGRF